jgi:uncharacterized membrane protein (GlpM family)
MDLLFFKLSVTPLLIVGLTLAARRWGPKVGGLLTGLPLASGPILAFLALQHGLGFAARAALGTLSGIASVAVFCLAYATAARRWPWPVCALAGAGSFLALTTILRPLRWELIPATALTLAVLSLVLYLLPQPALVSARRQPPRWDLPCRAGVTTLFVVVLTSLSSTLGPRLSGLLAPFPAFALVLAAFTHAQQGATGSIVFLRGIVLASFASCGFFLASCLSLPRLGLAATLALATLLALFISWLSYRMDASAAQPKPASSLP